MLYAQRVGAEKRVLYGCEYFTHGRKVSWRSSQEPAASIAMRVGMKASRSLADLDTLKKLVHAPSRVCGQRR
jgi:hypothetical protein